MSKNQNLPAERPYSVSQNFLTSRRLIHRLLQKADLAPTDTVVEIGAGKGHITRALSERCKTVLAYEIDRSLCEKLAGRLGDNVRLYCGDFLRAPLPAEPYKVFANIPFSITTEIVRKLIAADPLPEGMWLVMEKGAAKRFCGLPRPNLTSLKLRPFYDLRIRHTFRREDFHPAPRVDAVLLEFKRKPRPDIQPSQRRAYDDFLTYSFAHGLFGPRALLTKKQIATALRLAGLPGIAPTGEILYVQWLCLFRCWAQFGQRQARK